jgi:hypothetical protein
MHPQAALMPLRVQRMVHVLVHFSLAALVCCSDERRGAASTTPRWQSMAALRPIPARHAGDQAQDAGDHIMAQKRLGGD